MKNRGFTLVELLAVITIMALLALASFELLDSVNKGNKEKSAEIQIKNILDAAISYVPTSDVILPKREASDLNVIAGAYDLYTVENGEQVQKIDPGVIAEKVCISLDYLQADAILENNIENPINGEVYENALICIVLVNSSTKTNIEKQLESEGFIWLYDGPYLYYFNTGNRGVNVLG